MTRFALALALALSTAVPAAAQDQDQLKKNLEEKLAKPFAKNNPWVLDFDEAKAAAKKDGRLIFAYFTRSYAT